MDLIRLFYLLTFPISQAFAWIDGEPVLWSRKVGLAGVTGGRVVGRRFLVTGVALRGHESVGRAVRPSPGEPDLS